MHIRICTIGFTGKTAEEFFRLLEQGGVRRVVDVRENRIGQLSGYAKYPDVAFFLQRIGGIDYIHMPELAPSPEIRKAYRDSKDWPAYETAFLELMKQRGVPESVDMNRFTQTTALLCSEPRPEKCHRRLVAELLAAHWGAQGNTVEVQHLVTEKSKPAKRGRKGARARQGTHPE